MCTFYFEFASQILNGSCRIVIYMSVYIILMLSVSAIKLYLYVHRCNESCVCMSTNYIVTPEVDVSDNREDTRAWLVSTVLAELTWARSAIYCFCTLCICLLLSLWHQGGRHAVCARKQTAVHSHIWLSCNTNSEWVTSDSVNRMKCGFCTV